MQVLHPTPYVQTGKIQVRKEFPIDWSRLLERPLLSINDHVASYYAGKTIVVAGGAGSIGSLISSNLLEKTAAQSVVVLDNCESSLHQLQLKYPRLVCRLVDIKDNISLQQVFDQFKPDILFHCAAYKCVDTLETDPCAALRNNVLGTTELIDTACQFNVPKVVLLSSDKAVQPANIMGVTKSLQESHCLHRSVDPRYRTDFSIVRFGNVVGSSNSVVNILAQQIYENQRPTVVPGQRRFFMAPEEAWSLSVIAGAIGHDGQILIGQMGKLIGIEDLSKRLGDQLRLPMKPPYWISPRAGDKLEEMLYDPSSEQLDQDHSLCFVKKPAPSSSWIQQIQRLRDSLDTVNHEERLSRVGKAVAAMVPEYNPTNLDHVEAV